MTQLRALATKVHAQELQQRESRRESFNEARRELIMQLPGFGRAADMAPRKPRPEPPIEERGAVQYGS